MNFYPRYELMERLPGEGIWSFRARDIATGKPVTVHLLVDGSDPEYDTLLQRVRRLAALSSSLIVEIGKQGNAAMVVTAAPPFLALVAFLREIEAAPTGAPPAEASADAPGEFTRMFGPPPGNPAEPPPPATSETTGEFTRLFQSPPGNPTEPPPPASSETPGEFTRMFGPPFGNPAEPPQPASADAPGEFTRMFQPPSGNPAEPPQPASADAPGEFTRMFQPPSGNPAEPPQPASADAPGEFTRMFQPPSGNPAEPPQPASADAPGEFTRMFQPPSGNPAEPPQPASADAPGEFTRLFQSPPGNFKSSPGNPAEPPRPASTDTPGGFTQMFGSPHSGSDDPTATEGTASPAPQPSHPGPSEYTRMMSRPASTQAGECIPPPSPSPPSPPLAKGSSGWIDAVFSRFRRRPPALPVTRTVDHVHVTVTAPAALQPGHAHELRLWAHLENQMPGVLERARAAFGTLDPRRILRKTEGPFEIPRDTSLHIRLSVEDIAIADPHKIIRWTGDIGCAAFVVKVPPGYPSGPKAATASIRVQGTELAKVDFVLNVGMGRTRRQQLPARLTRHRAAFASYASEDRDAVLARIQGIQKAAPYMQIFVDVISLRSGEDWERRLLDIIPRMDVFYLFWCRHAKGSQWVEREWRCAYQAKGIDFIDPVPLEPAAAAPPPAELARKHFSEPILAYLGDHAPHC